jgi:hypothetical protein
MKNFDKITENYGFKEVAIYKGSLIIGYKIDRYKKEENNIFTFDKTIKEVIF